MIEPTSGPISRLRALLHRKTPTFGLIATIPSIQTVQVLANAGVDWLIIDMEHGPVDIAGAHAMIAATSGTPAVPLVRLPWQHPWQAKTVLDLGALGVCFPMVLDGKQAESAIRSVRYPPIGDRLWGPFYAPMRWNRTMPGYIERANEDVLAIITVEHPQAVANIDEIAVVPGLDLVFIGPGDLAMSLGIPGQFDHPKFKAAVARAEAGVLRANVPLGGVARTPDQARQMLDRGYSTIVFGFDWLLLHRAVTDFLEQVRL